jgi:hypothetical protein
MVNAQTPKCCAIKKMNACLSPLHFSMLLELFALKIFVGTLFVSLTKRSLLEWNCEMIQMFQTTYS